MWRLVFTKGIVYQRNTLKGIWLMDHRFIERICPVLWIRLQLNLCNLVPLVVCNSLDNTVRIILSAPPPNNQKTKTKNHASDLPWHDWTRLCCAFFCYNSGASRIRPCLGGLYIAGTIVTLSYSSRTLQFLLISFWAGSLMVRPYITQPDNLFK